MTRMNEFGQPIGHALPDWTPAAWPSMDVVLQGQYCRLEPFRAEVHAASLLEALLNDNPGDSWTYLPYGPCQTVDEFVDWSKQVHAAKDFLYAILDETTGAPIGIAGYLRINPVHGAIEIGHVHFSKALQKTPAATEAMYLMMKHAFEDLGYRRYEWKCDALNQPSRRAALRFGFTFEGIFRQAIVIKNRNRDTAWFSMLDSEWPTIKTKLVQWLSANNFDADGKQIKGLNDF